MEDELEKAMGKENADRLRSDMEKSIPEDQIKKKNYMITMGKLDLQS